MFDGNDDKEPRYERDLTEEIAGLLRDSYYRAEARPDLMAVITGTAGAKLIIKIVHVHNDGSFLLRFQSGFSGAVCGAADANRINSKIGFARVYFDETHSGWLVEQESLMPESAWRQSLLVVLELWEAALLDIQVKLAGKFEPES